MVTGANSGIGIRRSNWRWPEVRLFRHPEQSRKDATPWTVSDVIFRRPGVRAEVLDLASLRSVRSFAARIGGEAKLDLLVNNAGVVAVPKRQVMEDGFELQFGTNFFLGPFAPTMALLPALTRAQSPRVTTVSSGAANMGLKKINFGDLQWERSHGPWTACCQSKLADLMFALELGRRSASAGIQLVSNAARPGYARTNLQTSGLEREKYRVEKIMEAFLSHDAARGALPSLRTATTEDAVSGSYFAPDRMFQLKGDPVPVPIPKPAQNEAAARQLWETAEGLPGAACRVAESAHAGAGR